MTSRLHRATECHPDGLSVDTAGFLGGEEGNHLGHFLRRRDAAGWTNGDVNTLTNTQMASHWFTKSQFSPVARKHYETLSAAAAGVAFVEPYEDLFDRVFGSVKRGGNAHRRSLSQDLRNSRTFFNNTMTP